MKYEKPELSLFLIPNEIHGADSPLEPDPQIPDDPEIDL